jgi:hypothetical protein
VNTVALETRLASGLQGLRRPDGGFPASAGAPSELESTAVASLALDDGRAEELTEPGEGPTHGGLRHPEHGGCRRHLPDLGDDDEDGQQPHDGPELRRSHALIV